MTAGSPVVLYYRTDILFKINSNEPKFFFFFLMKAKVGDDWLYAVNLNKKLHV